MSFESEVTAASVVTDVPTKYTNCRIVMLNFILFIEMKASQPEYQSMCLMTDEWINQSIVDRMNE